MAGKGSYRAFKRIIDIAGAGSALVLLSPILAGTALVTRIAIGSPVLFVQPRSGHGEETFHLYKFRTMLDTRDAEGKLLPDAERVSKFGQIVRKLSLDELPGLLNVLKGEMSLVGPRPLLVRYGPHYNDFQRRRFEVKPGITGLAQVNGRNGLTWDEKFAYDVEYVDGVSLWMDIRIVLKTVVVVLGMSGTTDGNRVVGQKPFDQQ